MARKAKIDTEKLKGLVGSRTDFYNEVERQGGSKSYARLLFNKMSKGAASKVESAVPKAKVETPTVTIESSAENAEAEDLKKVYGKMFNDIEEGETPTADTSVSEESTGESGGESGRNYHLRLGQLLHMFGKNVDNFVWKERPLTPEEEADMRPFSDDVETSFGDTLDGENSQYMAYAIAYFGIPAFARMDLIPKKIEDFIAWIKKLTAKNDEATQQREAAKREAQARADSEAQSKATVSNVPANINKGDQDMGFIKHLSDQQRKMLEDYRSRGYTVDVDFDPNLPIDAAALTQNHLKNKVFKDGRVV
jgi:outer membrane murein-binding lipoprotein Lpp